MNCGTDKHPCYSADAHTKYARMHLPVAPKCNVSCNYCNRKFDCVNESRPGVTSEVLKPFTALQKFKMVKEKIENLTVVGIAGPGDALANWEETKATIKLIKDKDPETNFCLSTNGLMLPDYAGEIVKLGVNHVTVTVNSVDPNIGAMIYKHVFYNGFKYRGILGAKVLQENQLEGIKYLTEKGVLVKINIVMIKGINDTHIPEVVKRVKDLKVFITNIMPLIPAKGSEFEDFPQTSAKELKLMRDICEVDVKQMRHCKQCRADAIGLLGEDRSKEFSCCTDLTESKDERNEQAAKATRNNKSQVFKEADNGQLSYKIALVSKYGNMIDQHFGYASEFYIYQGDGETFKLIEKRQVGKYCTGIDDCGSQEDKRDMSINILSDCDAVLTMRIGYHAKQRLLSQNIQSIESCDSIENALKHSVQLLKQRESA